MSLTDVTTEHLTNLHLRRAAHHDTLTGLPNRGRALAMITAAMTPSDHPHLAALMFIDIDQLKRINDSLGHHVGDVVLQACAERLQGAIRATDTLARVGGDEFVVLVAAPASAADLQQIARRCTTPSRTQSSPMSTPSPSAPVSALPASTRPGQQRPPIFYARPMPPCIRPKRQVRAKPDSCRYIRPPLGTDPTQTRVIPLRRPNAGCRYAAGNVGHSQLARRARYIALSARCTLPSESVCPSIVVRSPPHRHKALIPVT